jgi:hypothetical protein
LLTVIGLVPVAIVYLHVTTVIVTLFGAVQELTGLRNGTPWHRASQGLGLDLGPPRPSMSLDRATFSIKTSGAWNPRL